MALSLYEKVSLNFGSGVVAVAIVGVLSYASLGKLAATTSAVGDAEAVLEQIDDVRARIAEAGASQRDYLLTGNEERRRTFENASAATSRALNRIRALTGAESQVRASADSLTPAIEQHLDELARIAGLRERSGADVAIAALVGANVFSDERTLQRSLDALREDQRLVVGSRARAQSARTADAAVLLAIGLLISFIAAALALGNIRRYLAERRRLEVDRAFVLEQEQAARAAAEEANRAKTDFLRMMSHELRTPLTAIQGYLELLEMGIYGGMTEEQLTVLKRIESNERHLLAIINDLLDFARVDARRVELRLTPVRLSDIRLAVDPLCRPQLDAKELRYSWRLSDDLVTVRADREKLRQIVLNLVSNACKFTPQRGAIDVECVRGEQAVEIRVRDTGPGIPGHKLEAIFEPFVQLDNGLNRSTTGTGLGLAISRELARAMNGELTVSSVVGSGSTFILTLPRGDVAGGDLVSREATASLWESARAS